MIANLESLRIVLFKAVQSYVVDCLGQGKRGIVCTDGTRVCALGQVSDVNENAIAETVSPPTLSSNA